VTTSPSGPVVGVDTGGTFTDLALIEGGRVRLEKVPSTPDDPSRALLAGLERLGLGADSRPRGLRVVHGTTVGLNALLTGRTARAALVTNAGFVDLIELARQDRSDLYALHPQKPPELVPRELRFEVRQRSWPRLDGRGLEEVAHPTARELAALRRELAAARPEAIAICLLHSYADPKIERAVADALAPLGVPLTLSAELLREHREYERFSTAVVNAVLTPVVGQYIARLLGALDGARLELLRSSGGTISAERAAREPVRVIASGPAGGVLGASRAAREAGFDRMVGLDIGGTSADVAFRRLGARRAVEPVQSNSIGGYGIGVPSLDLHTIGCGGGSLLRVDSSGVLSVGPQSAGAVPGPVCYGLGEELTLTDAHVLLGHIASGPFLAGRLELDHARVERAFERLGRKLGLRPRAAAQAALDVARAAMRRALGVMTLQRGEDPREVPLVAFGGGGGLHAADLAFASSMPCALVPSAPGVLSALGMAAAEPQSERSASILAPLERFGVRTRAKLLRELEREALRELAEMGHSTASAICEASLDLRYSGQSFELRVPLDSGDPQALFHARHRELYGYTLDDRGVELVNVRVLARIGSGTPRSRRIPPREVARAAFHGERRAWFAGRELRARLVERTSLRLGDSFEGPAIVQEFSGTTLVPPKVRASVTAGGHLLLQRRSTVR
jgi:N-methylhydantoinase A